MTYVNQVPIILNLAEHYSKYKSPQDAAEINARIHIFVNEIDILECYSYEWSQWLFKGEKYADSRDAIKTMRPPRPWKFSISDNFETGYGYMGHACINVFTHPHATLHSPFLSTEELAELYVTVMALDHHRHHIKD